MLATHPVLDAYIQSDVLGKGIFLLLFVLSLITWILFFTKWIEQRKARLAGAEMREVLERLRYNPLAYEGGGTPHPFLSLYQTLKEQAFELLRKNKEVFQKEGRVFLSRSDIDLLQASLSSTLSKEGESLSKNLFLLSTIVSLAPFLGLLGTVWGILLTFSELKAGGAANTNTTVMNALAMALGTTVVGLIVAIPALIAYNFLRASLATFLSEAEDFSQKILTEVEVAYRKVDIQ